MTLFNRAIIKLQIPIHSLVFGIWSLSLGTSPVNAGVDLGFAQDDGGLAGSFLEYAGSARTMAMAGATTGVSDDANAALTNPAGLATLERGDVVSSYSTLFENTNFGVLNVAQPTSDMGTFGLGLVSLQSKKFERRDMSGRPGGSFTTSELAMLISHGIKLRNGRYSLGSTFKIIREEVASFAGTGYGLDGGAQMRVNRVLNLGATLRNVLAPAIKLRNEKDAYPLDLRVGARWQAHKKLMVAFDLDQTVGRSPKPYLGGEWLTNELLVLRAGLNEKEITTGIGLKFKDWSLDYAFGYHDAAAGISDLGSSHRFGFRFSFGKNVVEQVASNRWLKKGQAVLAKLRLKMGETGPNRVELDALIADAREVIHRQGLPRAQDLYAAQGYVSYFTGEYERAIQSLSESLALDPENIDLAQHLETARAQLTEERTTEILLTEHKIMKDLYEKADWQGTLASCEKVLAFRPDDAEALTYQEEARKRLMEPIEREMKIAKLKFERGEYLDSIKGFQRVKELDPSNQEATDLIASAIAALERQANADQAAAKQTGDPSVSVYEIPRNVEQSRALYSKGLVFYSEGNLKEAAFMWERAMQHDSKNVLARNAYNRAQIEMRESR